MDWATRRKVFVDVTRVTNEAWELLVFDSLDQPGFEVPKGAVEGGESLEEAVRRELLEEASITDARIIRELGATDWGDERQHFFLVEAPPELPRSFSHTVTGNGCDAGLCYQFRWLSIAPELRDDQGQRAADGELDGRDRERPNPRRRPANDVDVHRPPERAGEDRPVAEASKS